MNSAALTDRSLISVKGEDASHFLENLVTCSVATLQPGNAAHGALLTPQGKILFDFMIVRRQDGFEIETGTDIAEALATRLAMYKLRAKVELGVPQAAVVRCVWDEGSSPGQSAYKDPRHPDMGWREHCVADTGNASAYAARRISLGVPESGADFMLGEVWPHEVLMDLNHGIDFQKGCFVGQEVVSRMQHRGSVKKRVVQVTADAELLATGTPIEADGRDIGRLGSTVGNSALALIRLDRYAAAGEVLCGGVPVRAQLPPWTGLHIDGDD